MKVVADTSFLLYMLDPSAAAPLDPATGNKVEHCAERIDGLIESLEESGSSLVVPTPVLSELLIKAGGAQNEYLAAIRGKRCIEIYPFDEMAAIENASLRRNRKLTARKRGESKKEVSFDLQVVAVARAVGAAVVYSDDEGLQRRCNAAGMPAKGIASLPIPDSKRQQQIELVSRISEPEPGPFASAQLGERGGSGHSRISSE